MISTLTAWLIGVSSALLVVDYPRMLLAVRGGDLRLVLATANACVAVLAAYLIHQRYRREGRHQDLLVAQGLLLLGVAGLGLTVLGDSRSGGAAWISVWLPECLRALGGSVVLAGTLSHGRRVTRWASRWRTVLVPALLAILTALVLAVLKPAAPAVVLSGSSSSLLGQGDTRGSVALIVLEVLSAGTLLSASVLFALQARERQTPIFIWQGPAFALLGFARLSYLIIPTAYTNWVYIGDLLRAACYGLLAMAAFHELHLYWTSQAKVAVLDDRRRLARDLHDGVVQEIAYIRAEAHRLPHAVPEKARILDAADRGLDEARTAVRLLGRVPEETLHETIRLAARDIATRFEVDLRTDLDETIHADPEQKQALMRIVREAISNAARHGRAKRVFVRLDRGEGGFALRVEDDGQGFDPAAVHADPDRGYGLTSMSERARLLPGTLTLVSAPNSGTVVTVQW